MGSNQAGYGVCHWRKASSHPPTLTTRRKAYARLHSCRTYAASTKAADAAGSRGAVLVVPAFYLDASVYVGLVEELRARGYNAALPPVRWFNWVPTLGGRSMRPILDRIDYALTQLVEGAQVSKEDGYEIALPQRGSPADWVAEFRDASRGAQPPIEPAGPYPNAPCKAAIVASSAAGWISRILLGSTTAYGGRVYHGADRCHTLVTLGSPHTSAEPVTRRNIDFVNQEFPGAHQPGVRYVSVASRAVQGRKILGGIGDFAYQSYDICCGDGTSWGDGVTPVDCALLEGSEHILLEGARHVPLDEQGGQYRWYGSSPYLEAWISCLDDPHLQEAGSSPGVSPTTAPRANEARPR